MNALSKYLSRAKYVSLLPSSPVNDYIAVLIPAHNEAGSIASTIEAQLNQTRVADKIVVICDNCTDDTYEIASQYPVVVVRTKDNKLKKPGALNWAWKEYAQEASIVVCLDADTVLSPNAIEDWAKEFQRDPLLAGSSSKFTMRGDEFLVCLQRAEFAKWTTTGLRRGWTSVLAGTGCAIRNTVLKEIAARDDRDGPWLYSSAVEDFELTYRIREMGYLCHISPSVRAYTDAMRTMPALWAQRMKWQVGTVEDLLAFGVNRLTLVDWFQQMMGLFAALLRIMWVALLIIAATPYGTISHSVLWVLLPFIFIASDTAQAFLIPHYSRKDILFAALLVPQELFAWMRAGWFTVAWWEVLVSKLTSRGRKDRWSLQYAAEGSS
ncbi:MAG TPA: glycosyltransferase family 2 protein [Candidatus Saccharimonadales bacterium]|nr:glycosyltransferase family 2 protein [Candidatus Saccharimonadales bacterium]